MRTFFVSFVSLRWVRPARSASWLAALPRMLCLVYAAVLLWLLITATPYSLVPDPSHVSGPLRRLLLWGHFWGFALLTLFALTLRWRIRRRTILLYLTVGAAATELAQVFIPERVVEPRDLAQNLMGIAVGAVVYWLSAKLVTRRAGKITESQEATPG